VGERGEILRPDFVGTQDDIVGSTGWKPVPPRGGKGQALALHKAAGLGRPALHRRYCVVFREIWGAAALMLVIFSPPRRRLPMMMADLTRGPKLI